MPERRSIVPSERTTTELLVLFYLTQSQTIPFGLAFPPKYRVVRAILVVFIHSSEWTMDVGHFEGLAVGPGQVEGDADGKDVGD